MRALVEASKRHLALRGRLRRPFQSTSSSKTSHHTKCPTKSLAFGHKYLKIRRTARLRAPALQTFQIHFLFCLILPYSTPRSTPPTKPSTTNGSTKCLQNPVTLTRKASNNNYRCRWWPASRQSSLLAHALQLPPAATANNVKHHIRHNVTQTGETWCINDPRKTQINNRAPKATKYIPA